LLFALLSGAVMKKERKRKNFPEFIVLPQEIVPIVRIEADIRVIKSNSQKVLAI
jgi:hypothetical protein